MNTENENQETDTAVYKDDAPPLAPTNPGEPAEDPVPGTENKGEVNQPQDPDTLAGLVAKQLQGLTAIVRSGAKHIKRAMDTFDRDGRLIFLKSLGVLRVIPAAEAGFDRHGPTVRKYLEIANADWLDQPELKELLPFGYTPMYHLVLLYEQLPEKSPAERLKRLVSILQTAEGAITRQWLIDQKKKLKENQSANEESHTGEPAGENGDASETDAEKDDGNHNADLLLLTPGPSDFAWLRQEYAAGYLEDCLQLRDSTDEKDAAVVIVATFSDLAEVLKLLKLCGFRRPTRRLLARLPSSSDVDSEVVVVVAKRGAMKMTAIVEGEWLADGKTIDPTKIAEKRFPGAKRKVHAFAETETGGWKCLTSKQTWKKEPKLND